MCGKLAAHQSTLSQFTLMRFRTRILRFTTHECRFHFRKARFTRKRRLHDKPAGDGMVRKSRKQRNAEQVVISANGRAKAKAEKVPSRDDIARTALWVWISNTWANDPDARATLDLMRNDIVDDLVIQGFHLEKSLDVFDYLAQKYRSGERPFRIKRHLQTPPQDGEDT